MKKEEKILLKRNLEPLLASSFERDAKLLIEEYPFLNLSEDDIEDDYDLPLDEGSQVRKRQPFEDVIPWNEKNSQLKHVLEDATDETVQILYRAAWGVEEYRGLYLSVGMGNKWYFKLSSLGRGYNIVPVYRSEDEEYLISLGYKLMEPDSFN